MKSVFVMLAPVLVMSTLVGCNMPKYDAKVSYEAPKLDDLKLGDPTVDYEKITEALYFGGQPGAIKISGAAVKTEEDKTVLDERITVSQSVGQNLVKNDAVTMHVAKDNLPLFSSKIVSEEALASLKERSSRADYINVGCKQLDPSLVEGLTEIKEESETTGASSLKAKTIVICGKVELPYKFSAVSADNIILIDADFSNAGSPIPVYFAANTLTLTGSNSISTRGVDSPMAVVAAASVELTVAKAVEGEGTLTISSVGGDCVKEVKK